MAQNSPSDPSVRLVRTTLDRWSRGGGIASTLALALPLLSGALLLVQAWLVAHVLHLAIADGIDLEGLLTPVGWFATVLVLRIGLGLVGELCATAASETIKLKLVGSPGTELEFAL